MGGICSKSSTFNNVPSSGYSQVHGHSDVGASLVSESLQLGANGGITSASLETGGDSNEHFSFPELRGDSRGNNANSFGENFDDVGDGIPRLPRVLSHKFRSTKSKQVAVGKVSEVSSFLGKAGSVGLDKAVEVLDTLGSSMTSLHLSGSFVSGVTTKGNKVAILAFEVANTIVKGSNLTDSLSKENIKYLKEVVLRSECVQNLISRDIDELQRIAAADKREELKIFSREVVRFGNSCKDPQYHNLDRYFEKLASEVTPQKKLKEEANTIMPQLLNLVHHTAELYHELNALDRYEQDHRRKRQEEDNPTTSQRGDSLGILRAELKSQKKLVRSLKKKSLWSKILEEVMEKLVDIVHLLHLEIYEAFGSVDSSKPVKRTSTNHKKLGPAGLALHYANIITQIDTLVSRPHSVPSNMRDGLYQGLSPNVKSALRFKLQSLPPNEELTSNQIKVEMEKTLQWFVPLATNTTKAHHGFGWVGEWANTGLDANRKPAGQSDLLKIETLYHADQEKTDLYILDLVVLLHRLIAQSRTAGYSGTARSPIKSPSQKPVHLGSSQKATCPSPTLTSEDREMLRYVSTRKHTPGISKSQEFETDRIRGGLSKHNRLSKSSSHSPARETRRPSSIPVVDFDIDRIKALDIIDRVDTLTGL